jgi:hypothetical protein
MARIEPTCYSAACTLHGALPEFTALGRKSKGAKAQCHSILAADVEL